MHAKKMFVRIDLSCTLWCSGPWKFPIKILGQAILTIQTIQKLRKMQKIPLEFRTDHSLYAYQHLYLKLNESGTPCPIRMKYTIDPRPGASPSLKLTAGWPAFYNEAGLLINQVWMFKKISKSYGHMKNLILRQATS